MRGSVATFSARSGSVERVGATRRGFTIEKGFRGQHFEHISGFEGEQEILGGNQGYFPDFCRKLRRKVHFIPDSAANEMEKINLKNNQPARVGRARVCRTRAASPPLRPRRRVRAGAK